MRTLVAVAPEPKPSDFDDLVAFMELCLPAMSSDDFTSLYFDRKAQGWRLGQTFMNLLPTEYYMILTGSLYDPFYKNDVESVCKSLDWLLERI